MGILRNCKEINRMLRKRGPKAMTKARFRKWLRVNRKGIILVDYGGSLSSNESVFKCKKCGKEWKTTGASVKSGSGCPSCNRKSARVMPEERVRAEWKNKDIELVKYAGSCSSPNSVFKCKKCGYVWTTCVSSLRSAGTGCAKCHCRSRITKEDAVKWLKKNKPNVELVEWGGKRTAISKYRCKKCGYEWSRSFLGLVKCAGCGCARCSGVLRIDEETARKWLIDNNPNISLVSYGGAGRARSRFRCNVCGYEWETGFRNIKNNGSGCSKCDSQSKFDAEKLIKAVEDRGYKVIKYGGSIYAKSRFKCTKCGYEWESKLYTTYRSGKGCMGCYKKGIMWTEEGVKNWLVKNKPKVELLEYGGGVMKDSRFKCHKCGNVWTTKFFSLRNSIEGCPKWQQHRKQGLKG